MSAEEKKRNEILSRIAADLFVKPKGGEELSPKIQRLRDEIKKVIEGEDTIFGKFRGLVDSFREIIPEEKQRYHAAIKALSTTAKLSQQDIVKAVNNQLGELKILEKGLLSTPSGWRDELKAMEAKSRGMKDEISKLREKIGRLEREEQEVLNGMAAREKEMEFVEKAVGELFTDIAAEIADINKKVEEFTAEGAVSRPIPPVAPVKSEIPRINKRVEEFTVESAFSRPIPPVAPVKSEIPSEEIGGSEQKSGILEPSAPQQDSEWQKKCPMCGGQMNFHSKDEMWICYSCAYEELTKDGAQGKSEEKREHANTFKPTPVAEPIFDPSPPRTDPLASLSSDESQESTTGSPSNKQPSKKKTCPVCRKKMNWYEMDKAWQCPFCEYERRI